MDFWISDWISGFHSGFLDFTVDFWISQWISGFQLGFLDFWISVWISADSVRDFFRDGPLVNEYIVNKAWACSFVRPHVIKFSLPI